MTDDDVYVCPDCHHEFDDQDEFVQHRVAEHPPRALKVTIPGIESEESVLGQKN